jgi:hypothetical protein
VANPRGGENPYLSPDGHNIVDVRFYEGMKLFGEDAQVRQQQQQQQHLPLAWLAFVNACHQLSCTLY